MPLTQSHLFSVYFAPRGYKRMAQMGMQLAQQHLTPFDRLTGFIGEAAPGQSLPWTPPRPGRHTLRVVDDHGRVAEREVEVVMER